MAGQAIKLITFDAYLTLFKPIGSVSLQYVTMTLWYERNYGFSQGLTIYKYVKKNA